MIDKVIASLNEAANETALYLTGQLRNSAAEHGWDSDVVKGLRTSYSPGSGFSVHASDSTYERAHKHEYGTQDIPPTAVIRKLNNNTAQAENFLVSRTIRRLGKR